MNKVFKEEKSEPINMNESSSEQELSISSVCIMAYISAITVVVATPLPESNF